MWNLPAPPGFQGLHPEKQLKIYARNMPHWRQDGATYFVTFRLGDSLPQSKLYELEDLRTEWLRRHPTSQNAADQLAKEIIRRVEKWLDQGYGSCHLREIWASTIVADAMHHFDGERYELGCFAVMANHVHGIVRPLDPATQPLERVLQSWKRFSAQQINERLGQDGAFWQEETFDRIIRDEEHLWNTIQYIGANPRLAGQSPDDCPRWIRPEWEELGWKFVDRTSEPVS